VQHVRAGVELDGAAFADEGDPAPLAGGADGELAASGMAGAVDRAFDALAAGVFCRRH